MLFNKISIPLLNFAQQIVTNTVSSNIGLNNIFAVIDANLESIRNLTDSSLAGGGISDQNIRISSISSVSTNLTMDTVIQGAIVTTAMAGADNVTAINFTITTNKPNTKIKFGWGCKVKGTTNGIVNGSAESRPQAFCQVSTNVGFTGIIFNGNVTAQNNNYNNALSSFFQGPVLYKEQVVTIPVAGVYFVRLNAGHSGNFTQQSEIGEGIVSYQFN